MWVAFANAKVTHIFFSKNISIYAIFNDQSFNDTLTNDIFSPLASSLPLWLTVSGSNYTYLIKTNFHVPYVGYVRAVEVGLYMYEECVISAVHSSTPNIWTSKWAFIDNTK